MPGNDQNRHPVTIKTPEEQDKMRVAGRLAADVLDMIGEHVKPGVRPTSSTASATTTSPRCRTRFRHR